MKKEGFAGVLIVLLTVAGFRSAAAPDAGVSSKEGLVVCTSAPACDAGAEILSKGGSAVDAAVATAFALAVTLPSAGNLAPGVPGTVRGLALAHKKFGKLSWKEVVTPAVRLAEDGFVISDGL